jgi:hypothetical protein
VAASTYTLLDYSERLSARLRSCVPCVPCCGTGNGLVELASRHVQHTQKALDQMNLQPHHVISDVTGTTGLSILDSVLAGERDLNHCRS